MYKLKNLAQRSMAFAAAVGLLSTTISAALPAVSFADALNPLTERSLMLSSSSPGWLYKDGSGNSTYAPPGSGPNGQKTAEIFSFKVSTDSSASGTNAPIKAFTFQYCTAPAGNCTSPGDGDDATHSNLDVNYNSSPVYGTDYGIYLGGPDTAHGGTLVDPGDWTITTGVKREAAPAGATGATHNFITLSNADSTLQPTAGTKIWIQFFASNNNYITNPGSDAFFVKLNTYNDDTDADPYTSTSIIDGGVTVANVMNDSIQIQTKVLETMSFSVGTTNPDTVPVVSPAVHGSCDPITVNDPLELGTSGNEFSLETDQAYDEFSYWRLSSNSSNGATVYYSGYTLSNTVGDQIDAIGTTAAPSHPGMEQFGLALTSDYDTPDTGALPSSLTPLIAQDGVGGASDPTNYSQGAGTINEPDFNNNTARFAFDTNSQTDPVVLATENTDVLECATGKMRYIANIRASTPAGIYTSKVNYIASPEY